MNESEKYLHQEAPIRNQAHFPADYRKAVLTSCSHPYWYDEYKLY